VRRTCVLNQVLASAAEVPGLWPFVLPVMFMIIEDDSNDIHKDRFNKPPPDGLGIAGKKKKKKIQYTYMGGQCSFLF
jgi:hypothetical protein